MIPKDATEKVQYEAELVVVIGKKAFQVKESEALNFVFGYSIGNDVSERSWQKSDRTLWRAKNSDTFKPMGPWIETEADLDDMTTSVHVNGVKTIEFKTNQMIFGVEKYIHEITKYITLYPGDMIIYRGCEIEHWREPFKGLNHAQVFFHYNEVGGQYDTPFDGRVNLGMPNNENVLNEKD